MSEKKILIAYPEFHRLKECESKCNNLEAIEAKYKQLLEKFNTLKEQSGSGINPQIELRKTITENENKMTPNTPNVQEITYPITEPVVPTSTGTGSTSDESLPSDWWYIGAPS